MKHISKYLLLACVISSSACSLLPTAQNANSSTISFNKQHILQEGKSIYRSHEEIEAVAATTDWLVWAEDPRRELWIAPANSTALAATHLATLEHGVDGICVAPMSETTLDVFISDGDGGMHHYWVDPQQKTINSVRRLATNPDVERCVISNDALIYQDPYLGTMSIDRNPETDPVIRPTDTAKQGKFIAQLSPASESSVIPNTLSLIEAVIPTISADIETDSVDRAGDAADDPAILLSKQGTLWIAGTDKQQGLRIYNAQGKQIHFLNRGRLNNVDSLEIDNHRFLLTATNRTTHSIDTFIAEPDKNHIKFLSAIPLAMDDPYGLCMAEINGNVAVFAGDSEGLVQYWQLSSDYQNGEMLNEYHFDSQTEGCVYNTADQQLYVGQEDTGIWKIAPENGERDLIESMTSGNLVADVEGLDIYYGEKNYLIASSQGDDSYVVYQLAPWKMLSKFRIGANSDLGLDGASETDGLAVTANPIAGYPNGILVVQDGRNMSPAANQNFKIINWQKVDKLLK